MSSKCLVLVDQHVEKPKDIQLTITADSQQKQTADKC